MEATDHQIIQSEIPLPSDGIFSTCCSRGKKCRRTAEESRTTNYHAQAHSTLFFSTSDNGHLVSGISHIRQPPKLHCACFVPSGLISNSQIGPRSNHCFIMFFFYRFTLFFHTRKSHVRQFCCLLLSTCKVKYFLNSLDTIQQNI